MTKPVGRTVLHARKGGVDRGLFERPAGSGIWWVRYADADGHERRERVGTKKLAKAVLEKRRTEIREHRFFPPQKTATLGDAVQSYLDSRSAAATARDMRRYAAQWTQALGESTHLRAIEPARITAAVAELRARLSPQSVAHHLSFLRRILRQAIAEGTLERDPTARLPLGRVDNARVRYLSDDEERRLLTELRPEDHDLVVFAIHTGLRQSEQFRLTWQQIDMPARLLRVPAGKGSARVVPLNATAADILRRTPRSLRTQRVFPRNIHNFLARQFLPALTRARVENFRWHDLRHTFASRLVQGGVDLETVRELLGHTSDAMTRRYAHLSPEHRARAVEVLATGTKTGTGFSES